VVFTRSVIVAPPGPDGREDPRLHHFVSKIELLNSAAERLKKKISGTQGVRLAAAFVNVSVIQ
jgi:hypothetical protein